MHAHSDREGLKKHAGNPGESQLRFGLPSGYTVHTSAAACGISTTEIPGRATSMNRPAKDKRIFFPPKPPLVSTAESGGAGKLG
jgi:hypothetical protein